MCTAVVGGLIHRADSSVKAARDQISATPITTHRTRDRRKPFRGEILLGMYGAAVTIRIIAGEGHLRTLIEGLKQIRLRLDSTFANQWAFAFPQAILRPRRARWRPRRSMLSLPLRRARSTFPVLRRPLALLSPLRSMRVLSPVSPVGLSP